MRMDRKPHMFTAKCRTVREDAGFRLTFFCEICGSGYTTAPPVCGKQTFVQEKCETCGSSLMTRCQNPRRGVQQFFENAKCTACGKPVGTGKFCNNCGASLALAVCPKCKKENAQGGTFLQSLRCVHGGAGHG